MNMKPVENTYKGGFFKNRYKLSWRAPIVVDALINTFDLDMDSRVIDLGCGIGDYVAEFEQRGYTAAGIEGSNAAQEFFVSDNIAIWDLRVPLENRKRRKDDKKVDLAFSLEVAEHIEPFYSGTYCDNLCSLSNTILISAASPGQKGHGHVNCAPRFYWIEKFRRRGYINMKGFEHKWRKALTEYRTKKELSSYFKNVICFQRQGG